MGMVSNSYVYLLHLRNEGEHANYQGLHQWNFNIQGNDFIIKHRTGAILNFTEKYSHLFEFYIRTFDDLWHGENQHWLEVILKKR
jgi:hypothetical protein